MSVLGLDPGNYSPHSFRRGGQRTLSRQESRTTSTSFPALFPPSREKPWERGWDRSRLPGNGLLGWDHLTQIHGDWRSDAYRLSLARRWRTRWPLDFTRNLKYLGPFFRLYTKLPAYIYIHNFFFISSFFHLIYDLPVWAF